MQRPGDGSSLANFRNSQEASVAVTDEVRGEFEE
jgi:hypothetical protein